MPREIDRKYGSGVTRISQNPSNRTPTKPLKKRKKMSANDPTKLPAGLKKDTTTSAYGDGGRGRPVPEFNQGGMCRGAGAAIKGTKFEGVF
ncbi:MAG: hypothetical protein HKN86_00375 [Acidimicrobiia bacterium]|nr:hypothetical protein [Acidimicrobiia bacterium]